MMKKSNKKGFTLVELIVVIAIMAILAAVLVPTVTNKIKDANESSANQTASAIANSVQSEVISILSGVATTNNKYVEGASGAVTGLKSSITSGTAFTEGKAQVTITYDATAGITVVATVSGQSSPVYTISVTDGKVTTPTT